MKLTQKDLQGKIAHLPLEVAQEAYVQMKRQQLFFGIEDLCEQGINGAFVWAGSEQHESLWIDASVGKYEPLLAWIAEHRMPKPDFILFQGKEYVLAHGIEGKETYISFCHNGEDLFGLKIKYPAKKPTEYTLSRMKVLLEEAMQAEELLPEYIGVKGTWFSLVVEKVKEKDCILWEAKYVHDDISPVMLTDTDGSELEELTATGNNIADALGRLLILKRKYKYFID
jgi:hypothetical protein